MREIAKRLTLKLIRLDDHRVGEELANEKQFHLSFVACEDFGPFRLNDSRVREMVCLKTIARSQHLLLPSTHVSHAFLHFSFACISSFCFIKNVGFLCANCMQTHLFSSSSSGPRDHKSICGGNLQRTIAICCSSAT